MPITPTVPNAYTLLKLTGIGEAPYAMRGLNVTLEPIPQASQIVRNINMGFLDIGDPRAKLYRVTVTCNDQRAPPFGGLWPGQAVTIESPSELGEVTLSSDRNAVDGSDSTEEGVTYFRPSLRCVVLSWRQGHAEYAGQYDWEFVAEEVPDDDPTA